MLRHQINRIPEKYRFLGFLVSTSIIGVVLIMYAVYSGSKELELIHAVDSLHRFATAQLNSGRSGAGDPQRLLDMAAPGYQVLVVRGGEVLADSHATTDTALAVNQADLEKSRVNLRGGYTELDGRILVWTRLPLKAKDAQLIILHHFIPGGLDALQQVYSRRLLVPAAFYIWLMAWMAFIVHFLVEKLYLQKRQTEYMALYDALSGLPNRNLLADRLNKLLDVSRRKQRRFAMAMIDLNGFKNVNDTHGHEAGDALLREIARRLGSCLRSADTLARVGGDEFVLLLDDTEQGSSMEICARVAEEIAKPVRVKNTEVQVSSSIGVASFPEHGDDAQTLTRKADQAMYAVKAEGGGIRLHGSAPASVPAGQQRPRGGTVKRGDCTA